jgi:flavin reductase
VSDASIGPSSEDFRSVLGRFATGVALMTTVVDDVPHGMTASAVSSVSLDPPLVLVCVDRGAVMAAQVVKGGVFALSFLAEDQAELSVLFADPARPEGVVQFAEVTTTVAVTGAAILTRALAWVDCRLWATYDGGDHLIVVGQVLDLGVEQPEVDPLVYYRSGYGGFTPAATGEPQ